MNEVESLEKSRTRDACRKKHGLEEWEEISHSDYLVELVLRQFILD